MAIGSFALMVETATGGADPLLPPVVGGGELPLVGAIGVDLREMMAAEEGPVARGVEGTSK